MADRMDQLITAAVRQGFSVQQADGGAWRFRKGIVTMSFSHTPTNGRDWMYMINTLRGAGLRLPEGS